MAIRRVGDNLGYWGCMAVACGPGKRRGVVPLQFQLWSTEDPEYKGENAEIEVIIDSIRTEVGTGASTCYRNRLLISNSPSRTATDSAI